MQALGAGKVEKGLVDRERFDQRRQFLHQLADLAADLGVFGHVGRQDDRFGTGGQRLEHRHGRADAANAGDIAAGRDDAALAAADDQRLVAQGGIVALFDGGIEGIAIEMGDRERVQFGMEFQAWPMTSRTARCAFGCGSVAVAAEAFAHGLSSPGQSQAAPRTPLESPWRLRASRVTTVSEKT